MILPVLYFATSLNTTASHNHQWVPRVSHAESRKEYASKEEIANWIRARIKEVEEELRILKSMLNMIEDTGRLSINEKVEEVKMGKRRIAKMYRGEGYIRVVPEFDGHLPVEVREYLESVKSEIEAGQAKAGVEEDERVQLSVKEKPDNSVAEIRFDNIHTTIEVIKAKAALKYAMEIMYQIQKARIRGEEDD